MCHVSYVMCRSLFQVLPCFANIVFTLSMLPIICLLAEMFSSGQSLLSHVFPEGMQGCVHLTLRDQMHTALHTCLPDFLS